MVALKFEGRAQGAKWINQSCFYPTYRGDQTACNECGARVLFLTVLSPDRRPPQEGDIALCDGCGSASIYDAAGKRRGLSVAELASAVKEEAIRNLYHGGNN